MNTLEHGLMRAGKVGASMAHDIVHGGARRWESLIIKLMTDDGTSFGNAVGGARGHGHEYEEDGVAKFWDRHAHFDVEPAMWIEWDGNPLVGCSPDRLLRDTTVVVEPTFLAPITHGLEVKSPISSGPVDAHKALAHPSLSEHYAQCQHSIMVTGLPWWLVVHFGDQYYEALIERDDTWIADYRIKLDRFLTMYTQGNKTRKIRLADLDT